jgi:hypothetical protein
MLKVGFIVHLNVFRYHFTLVSNPGFHSPPCFLPNFITWKSLLSEQAFLFCRGGK